MSTHNKAITKPLRVQKLVTSEDGAREQLQQHTGHDDPIADLIAFHGQIRAELDRLHALVRRAAQGDRDADAAGHLVRFFEGPLLWHDEDEDVSLMRRLRGKTLTATQQTVVETTHRGHEKMEALLDELLVELKTMAAGGLAYEPLALERNARSLKALLDGHLALEEVSLFPLVTDVLSAAELREIGREVQARHGKSAMNIGDGVRAKRAMPI